MAKKKTLVQEVASLFRANYRLAGSGWVGGGNEITVSIGDEPKASARSRKVWHRRHAWSGTDLEVGVTVSPSWRRSVHARGLAVLDGLLTTHAGRVVRVGEVDAYPASWVRQGRGLSIRAETGWVARHRPSGTSYHLPGGDAARAAAGLRRKMRNQAVPQEEKDERRRRIREARRARLERLMGKLARHDLSDVGHVVVTRRDSLKAGNCEPGTDQFIDTFFPDRTSATIAEIAAAAGGTDPAGLDERHLTLARQIAAACLAAIGRHRRERRGGASN
ncbi:hypothetical protein [Paludisphaera sp.]|uniref:hypothetical protein n=1 Tax=Paludisphaera sp. TaxID=2017432 RepID=UPI00301E0D9B